MFDFNNSYALLPERFYRRWVPTPVMAPRLIAFNAELARELGFQHSGSQELLTDLFAGNRIFDGAEPLAMAYAGHQFGHFVPQLGDGRALLLGEVLDRNRHRRDIQLKGSGQTPFSRGGDGRAALGPVIREYIVSEAMHALGVPTTRSLAAVVTGEPVYRETLLPGAVLTRVAASHIRIGTFEYFAARGDRDAVRRLADYAIGRHYPEAKAAANPYRALLEAVLERQARLMARWMHVGFVHGVMNTDNTAISGETIDYGPCAFLDFYEPSMVFSSIDAQGRYAFGNQPYIAQWNLARLAETLLSLFAADTDRAVSVAEEVLSAFPSRFKQLWLASMRTKIGLFSEEADDALLIQSLLDLMRRAEADYTLTFRLLSSASDKEASEAIFSHETAFNDWLERWQARRARQPQSAEECEEKMRSVNPKYIARNHRMEQAIQAAVGENDFSRMMQLNKVLAHPYAEQETQAEYAIPPSVSERVKQTFCGT